MMLPPQVYSPLSQRYTRGTLAGSPELAALSASNKGADDWVIADFLGPTPAAVTRRVKKGEWNQDILYCLTDDSPQGELFRKAFLAEYKLYTGEDLPVPLPPLKSAAERAAILQSLKVSADWAKPPGGGGGGGGGRGTPVNKPSLLQRAASVVATAMDPSPLITEADGYAAQLITAGALTQADYDTQKTKAKGTAWTLESATAWRDSVKKQLDDYSAKKVESGGMGWLLPVGIAAAAFLALRK